MAYSYYQRNLPGWGTQQHRFGRPPEPPFRPVEGWTGMDYYRAHAGEADPSYYTNAMTRLSTGSAMGAEMHEARHWHRLAYGGIGQVAQMIPTEIGHAAGYETYRQFTHHASIYESVNRGYTRQREALIGLAVAEAQRLWQETGRGQDQYGLQTASEAAAGTACGIFDHHVDSGTLGSGYSRERRNSFNASNPDPVDAAYADDDHMFTQPRPSQGSGAAMPMPIGGGGASPYAGQSTVGGGYSSSLPTSIYGGASPYNRASSAIPSSPYAGGASTGYPGGGAMPPNTTNVYLGTPYRGRSPGPGYTSAPQYNVAGGSTPYRGRSPGPGYNSAPQYNVAGGSYPGGNGAPAYGTGYGGGTGTGNIRYAPGGGPMSYGAGVGRMGYGAGAAGMGNGAGATGMGYGTGAAGMGYGTGAAGMGYGTGTGYGAGMGYGAAQQPTTVIVSGRSHRHGHGHHHHHHGLSHQRHRSLGRSGYF